MHTWYPHQHRMDSLRSTLGKSNYNYQQSQSTQRTWKVARTDRRMRSLVHSNRLHHNTPRLRWMHSRDFPDW